MELYPQATAVDAVPAISLDCGFRLLVLRQFQVEGAPPAFALIEQRLLRAPQRFGRHGISFANTFLRRSWPGSATVWAVRRIATPPEALTAIRDGPS